MSFARADLLSLLQEVVGELIIPDEVYDEIVIHGTGRAGSILLPWIKRVSLRDQTAVAHISEKLHDGERAAIALANRGSPMLSRKDLARIWQRGKLPT